MANATRSAGLAITATHIQRSSAGHGQAAHGHQCKRTAAAAARATGPARAGDAGVTTAAAAAAASRRATERIFAATTAASAAAAAAATTGTTAPCGPAGAAGNQGAGAGIDTTPARCACAETIGSAGPGRGGAASAPVVSAAPATGTALGTEATIDVADAAGVEGVAVAAVVETEGAAERQVRDVEPQRAGVEHRRGVVGGTDERLQVGGAVDFLALKALGGNDQHAAETTAATADHLPIAIDARVAVAADAPTAPFITRAPRPAGTARGRTCRKLPCLTTTTAATATAGNGRPGYTDLASAASAAPGGTGGTGAAAGPSSAAIAIVRAAVAAVAAALPRARCTGKANGAALTTTDTLPLAHCLEIEPGACTHGDVVGHEPEPVVATSPHRRARRNHEVTFERELGDRVGLRCVQGDAKKLDPLRKVWSKTPSRPVSTRIYPPDCEVVCR